MPAPQGGSPPSLDVRPAPLLAVDEFIIVLAVDEFIIVLAVDEFVIGEAIVVHRGALLVQLRLSALAARLLFGDPGAPLGRAGALCTALGFVAMLSRGLAATLRELALTRPDAGAFPSPHERDRERGDEHDRDDDDNDHNNCRHLPLLLCPLQVRYSARRGAGAE